MSFIVVAAVLWGTWPLYAREGGPPPQQVAFLVMLLMAAPAPFVFRRADFADRGAVAALVLAGLADAGNVALYFPAVARGPAVVAVLTHYLAPTLLALTAPWLLKEPLARRALPASLLILVGLALVLGGGEGFASSGPTALLGASSAVFYALNVLCCRRASRTFSPFAVTALHALSGLVALLVLYGRDAVPSDFGGDTQLILFGAVVNGLGGALLFNFALRSLTAQLVGVITYLEPLTAAVVGAVVLSQPWTVWTVLGALTVLVTGAWAAAEKSPTGTAG